MKTIGLVIWILACPICLNSCEKDELNFKSGDIELEIKIGDNWLHDFPLFLGIKKKNAPQFALWIEDTSGNYLSTIFATHKIATESWVANDGNRRKEALPHWCHQRGIIYDDGLMLPTEENPLTDGVTGATPTNNKTLQITSVGIQKPFVIKAEFNHSTDFNDSFPKDAIDGAENYSGGKMGSGQPALIYAVTINENMDITELTLIGHSSPDGSNGRIYNDLSNLSSANTIVDHILITIKK